MGRDDDEAEEHEPLPDPTMRTWRHPSELAAVAAMAAREELPPRRRRQVAFGSLLLGGALGAIVVLGLIGSVQFLDGRPDGSRFELQEAASPGGAPPVDGIGGDGRPTTTAPGDEDGDGGGSGEGRSRSETAPQRGASSTTIAVTPRDRTTPSSTAPRTTSSQPPATVGPIGGELAAAAVVVPAEAIVGVALDGSRAPDLRCSGLAVEGVVVTSSSAIGDAEEVILIVGGAPYPAPVLGRDPFTDIAVVAPPAGAPIHELPAAGPVPTGSPVALLATDGEPEAIAVVGRITGQDHSSTASDGHHLIGLVSTSARLPRPGAGSLLVDPDGALVGMVVDTPGHLALAVPDPTLRQVARSLRDTGHPVPVWVGVSVSGHADGAIVQAVTDGGPAARAGLRPGDVVTTIDGQPIGDLPGFFRAVRAHHAGDPVEVGYHRDGVPGTATVELAPPPPPLTSPDEEAAD